jgi:hypothetical protein
MSKSLKINLNTRVFLNKNNCSLGTVCNVIVKTNKNKTKTLFYNVLWDNKNEVDCNPDNEYTTKEISPIQIQVIQPTTSAVIISEQQELRYQQYAEECRQRGADHVEKERLKAIQLQLQQQQQHTNLRRTEQTLSNKLNRVHSRISNNAINYAISNTTIPNVNLGKSPEVDDGSFINQDAVKYEV